jgi:DNA-binding response OmpR family regulator
MSEGSILIVDDEPKLVRLVSEVLTATGFSVLTTANGKQAIELTAVEQPDLIVLDIVLAYVNLAVCQLLCSQPKPASQICSGVSTWARMIT